MPMMVCGSNNDGIVERSALQGWSDYLKDDDLLWTTPGDHHFFHYFFAEYTGRKIVEFWQNVKLRSLQVSYKPVVLEETCYRFAN